MNFQMDYLMYGLAIAFVVWTLLKRRGDITPAEAKKLVSEGAKLVDVRSPGEFAAGHIDGAVNVPVQELDSGLKKIGAKEKPVVVYCASGSRSAMAARMLKARGFAMVRNLGPMSRW